MEEIKYNDVKEYAKKLGVNVNGKKKEAAVEMIVAAAMAGYIAAKEAGVDEFSSFVKENEKALDMALDVIEAAHKVAKDAGDEAFKEFEAENKDRIKWYNDLIAAANGDTGVAEEPEKTTEVPDAQAEPDEDVTAKAKVKATKAKVKVKETKDKKTEAKAKVEKVGVIMTAVSFFSGKTYKTKDEALAHLVATFPDRESKSMNGTLSHVLKGRFKEARRGEMIVEEKDGRVRFVTK